MLDKPDIPEPYRSYRQWRSEAPVWPDPETGGLLFTRYADVSAALRHPQLLVSKVLEPAINMPKALQPLVRPSVRLFSRMMVLSDPPDHTRLRSLANRAFTPRAVEGMQPRIQAIADELLDAIDPSEPVDL